MRSVCDNCGEPIRRVTEDALDYCDNCERVVEGNTHEEADD